MWILCLWKPHCEIFLSATRSHRCYSRCKKMWRKRRCRKWGSKRSVFFLLGSCSHKALGYNVMCFLVNAVPKLLVHLPWMIHCRQRLQTATMLLAADMLKRPTLQSSVNRPWVVPCTCGALLPDGLGGLVHPVLYKLPLPLFCILCHFIIQPLPIVGAHFAVWSSWWNITVLCLMYSDCCVTKHLSPFNKANL